MNADKEFVLRRFPNAVAMNNHDLRPRGYYILESSDVGALTIAGPQLSKKDAWWRAAEALRATSEGEVK